MVDGLLSTEKTASIAHLVVVMTVLVLATALRLEHELDTPTIGTVFGAAMGYASGLTAQRNNGIGNGSR
jgi:hypothetical protein